MTNSQLFIEHCETYGFIGFSYNLSAKEEVEVMISENGKKKIGGKAKTQTKIVKTSKFPSGWNTNINKDNWKNYVKKDDNAFAILTGEKSNCTIIDFDAPESKEQLSMENPEMLKTMYDTTLKGIHVFTTYEPELFSAVDAFTHYAKIDILNDGRNCTCYPTTYDILMLDGSTKTVKYELTNDRIRSLKNLKTKLIADQKKIIKKEAISGEKVNVELCDDKELKKFFRYMAIVLEKVKLPHGEYIHYEYAHKRIFGEGRGDEFIEFVKKFNGYENKTVDEYNAPLGERERGSNWESVERLARQYALEEKIELDIEYSSAFDIKIFDSIYFVGYNEEIEELYEELKVGKLSRKKREELNEEIQLLKTKKFKETIKLKKRYFEKFHFKLLSPFCFGIHDDKTTTYYAENKFYGVRKNLIVQGPDGKNIKFVNAWTDMSDILTYEKIGFYPPPLICPKNHYNYWKGFGIEEYSCDMYSEEEKNEIIEIFNEHLRALSGYDMNFFKYMQMYIAHIIQRPGELMPTALVLRSKEEGAGKTQFFAYFFRAIFGDRKVLLSNIGKILNMRFNSSMDECMVVLMDEAKAADGCSRIDELKEWITLDKIQIERKGCESYETNKILRNIFSTNNQIPLKVMASNRRFASSLCSGKYIGNKEYFINLYDNTLKDMTKVRVIFDYLKTIQLDMGFLHTIPDTEYNAELLNANVPLIVRFFIDYTENENHGDDEKIYTEVLRQKFLKWLSKNGYTEKVKERWNVSNFGTTLNEYNEFIIKQKRTSHGFPYKIRMKDLNKYLTTKYKIAELDNENEDDDGIVIEL